MQYKLKLRKINPIIELPIYGHLCKPVHKGYKIFNFSKKSVVKIFDFDVDKAIIADELERMKMASNIDFAPALGKWNIDKRWYEEEYLSGCLPSYYKSHDSTGVLKSFKGEIIPCLYVLMLHKPIKSIKCSDYLKQILGTLKIHEHSREETDVREENKIRDFVYLIADRLSSMGNYPIYLVFSHGDFCPANMLTTKNGIKILDWEGAAYRSALYDFYSFFFYRPGCIDLPVDKMMAEINEALPMLVSSLSLKPSDIPESLSALSHIYRWIFYIEFIYRLVEREKTDNNLDIMNFIFRFINAFNRYEELVAGKPGLNSRDQDCTCESRHNFSSKQ